MLSRRNIRIKLLQLLYGYEVDEARSAKDVDHLYKECVRESYDLLLFILLAIQKTAAYAEQDAAFRKKKYVPDDTDRKFKPWLANNELQEALKTSNFHKELRKGFDEILSEEVIKSIYTAFSKEEDYVKYFSLEDPDKMDHVGIYLELMKFMMRDDNFMELLNDHFFNIDTDHSLLKGALKKTLKLLVADKNHYKALYPDEDAVENYGRILKDLYFENEEDLSIQVKKYLRNWDMKRIAILDKIILKMALIEMLHFPSIPLKVTLNEYVELAKSYSTDKSGEFVNGVLDNMMKKMNAEGLIKKTGRGLQE